MRQEAEVTGMCEKDAMSADDIVRLSTIEVYPQYLDVMRMKRFILFLSL